MMSVVRDGSGFYEIPPPKIEKQVFTHIEQRL